MKKIRLASTFASILVVCSIGIGQARSLGNEQTVFSDVPHTHWAYDAIMDVAARGIVGGIGDGKFGLEQQVTTTQFATMLTRAFFPDELGTVDPARAMSAWYGPYMHVADMHYLFSLTSASDVYRLVDGRDYWDPNVVDTPMSRYDLAQMLANLCRSKNISMASTAEQAEIRKSIPDDRVIPPKYQVAVWSVYHAGLIRGVDGQGRFSGDSSVTRAQAATVLSRFLSMYADDLYNDEAETPAATTGRDEPQTPAVSEPAQEQPATAKSHGKSSLYPTKGITAEPNANGYYSPANIDIGDAQLVYELLDLMNEAREKEGMSPYQWVTSDTAEEYTLLRAKELNTLFSHSRPCGEDSLVLENIARMQIPNASAQSVFTAWMNSKGHRDSILIGDSWHYRYACAARDGYCWVVTFWYEPPQKEGYSAGAIETMDEIWAPRNYHRTSCSAGG